MGNSKQIKNTVVFKSIMYYQFMYKREIFNI